MKIIAITQIQHTLNYLCMVYTQEEVATWEFLPEVSLACPFSNISDAKRAINERFPPTKGTKYDVWYVFLFPETSAAPRPENSPLLKHLKPTVEDILRNAADDLVREISRPLGFLRGQISQETLDAVDPAKKDPTE